MLKGDRQIDSSEIRYFMNAIAEKGVVVTMSTAGSGSALDHTDNVVQVSSNSSGTNPVGMLLDTVVDIDQTKQHVNWYKDETVIGNKVSLMTKGWVVTDKVVTATAGARAALASSGFVTAVSDISSHNQLTQPIVGRFRTTKDEDGFAAVYIDL